jgi:hypothetical protein
MASVMGLDCLAEESLIPEDPKDRVGPGIADLFDRDGGIPVYETTKGPYACGFPLATLCGSSQKF